MLKISIKIVFSLFVLIACVAAIQFGSYLYLSREVGGPLRADLAVVLAGSPERVEAGYELAQNGTATHLVIINQSPSQSQKARVKHKIPPGVIFLDGGKSRSTFEDVFITVDTITNNNIESIILVTSAYHLPRALFLLRTYLFFKGKRIEVKYYAVKENLDTNLRLKLGYNELIKLLGSTTELIAHMVTGDLILDSQQIYTLRTLIKDVLLVKT